MKLHSLFNFTCKSFCCIFCAILMVLPLMLPACTWQREESASTTGVKTTECTVEETRYVDPEQESIAARCAEILAVYDDIYMAAVNITGEDDRSTDRLSSDSVDAIEDLLYKEGFDVMDTNGQYPAYLTTSDRFYKFWERVQSGEDAEQEIIKISASGTLSYSLFRKENEYCFVYFMGYQFDSSGTPVLLNYEKHTVYDMELTDRGNCYYRIYPADDKHYADFSLIRLVPPDPALYDMKLRYITPVGYIATNLFLCDWTEEDYGILSFNDLWEFFYYSRYGELFSPGSYTYIPAQYSYQIPAAAFEEIVMPYFNISIDEFRKLANYEPEGDYYPWRPLDTNDFGKLWFYTIEPEVTACRNNPDGTVTLTVEVMSTDLKTDCIFAHEVTIRPLQDGGFQYAANKVTYQTEYGLPYCEARLSWGEPK